MLGRNSAIFTASLACYSSQLDQDTCIELMTAFNGSLSYPLSEKEIRKTIRSAYSGRYKGTSTHCIQLLNEQGNEDACSERLNLGVWYKLKNKSVYLLLYHIKSLVTVKIMWST